MPIYSYECENFHRFEELRPFDSDPYKCPRCGGTISRLPSLIADTPSLGFSTRFKEPAQVKGKSDLPGQRAGKTDKGNIDDTTPTVTASKSAPKTTPTRPGKSST